jgi:hypothetical protein
VALVLYGDAICKPICLFESNQDVCHGHISYFLVGKICFVEIPQGGANFLKDLLRLAGDRKTRKPDPNWGDFLTGSGGTELWGPSFQKEGLVP